MTRLTVGVALVLCVTLTSCGADEDQPVGEVSPTRARPSGDAVDSGERQFNPGDCATWEAGTFPVAETAEVVPCDEPHRVQVVALVGAPEARAGGYPSQAEWDQHEEVECWPEVERFLGRPLDPYGRFTIGSLIPTASAWESGDRGVWCGIWLNAPLDDDGLGRLYAEDVRQADQTTNYAPGTCVAGDATLEIEVVSCTDPHLMEVVERFTYEDRQEPPDEGVREALRARCREAVDDYVGGSDRLPVPWASGLETMHSVSWEAGTRTVHCFLGQVDANDEWMPVSGPVPR